MADHTCSASYRERRDADPTVAAMLRRLEEHGINAWPYPGLFETYVRSVRAIDAKCAEKQLSRDSVSEMQMAMLGIVLYDSTRD